ncbi:MAG TPA: LysR family transcriptional regulator [Arsenophonus sp.]
MEKYKLYLDIKFLSVFMLVAESGGLLQAGLRLNKSKSTISRWITDLEDTIGCELFNKRSNGSILEINGSGKIFFLE